MNHETPKQATKAPHGGHPEVPDEVRETPAREYDLELIEARNQDLINTEPKNLQEGFAEHPLTTGEIRLLPSTIATTYTQSTEEAPWEPTGVQQTKQEVNKKNRNWLIGGGTIAAIGSVVVGLVLSTPHDSPTRRAPEDTSTPAANSAPATPGTAEASTPGSAVTNPEKFVAKSEILKQTKTVEQMDTMTVEQFGALPYADRFAYLKAKVPTFNADSAAADDMLTQHPDYIPGGMWQPLKSVAFSTSDLMTGKKLYMSMFYYTTEPGTNSLSSPTQQAIQDVQNINGAGLNDSFEQIKHGEWQHGLDRAGKTIDFIDITAHQTSSIGGTEIPNSLLTYQAIRAQVQLLDGSTSYVYPQGYSTAGEGAPVPNYPY